MCYDYYYADAQYETMESIVVGVVMSALMFTLATAVIIIVGIVLGKKRSKRNQQQSSPENMYESIPLPPRVSQSEPGPLINADKTIATIDKDSDNEAVIYDDATSSHNFTSNDEERAVESEIELNDNEAYTSAGLSAETFTQL